ncbi:glycosyltransferase family 2 protein [Falsirhodobacter halotolerans]|uniref:glycosyltransferase family 2 protein n=1 Tax=Falsirhodobacter halotolerans TaxID=1146892 RepID=UPI001FD5FE37|nr:glycosyltransferase family 2 protein [Falsirhodobacter halotolerans]MCJ8139624.1 glycosyltransferase [Falsirhodobacter halotolerans]
MIALSVIIPVWNDRSGLKRLVDQIIEYGIAAEIIICDDASDEDHSPAALGLEDLDHPQIIYMRSDRQQGAGAMRNYGLQAASCDHVLYFDSDDLLAPGIKDILTEIEDRHFDFCIFRHHDSRVHSHRGTFASEERLWDAARATDQVRRLNMTDAAHLAQLSAYPWNKIYRRDFLTSENIRCTEIPVHNDIELHWTSFIAATTILCTKTIGAEHFVVEGGTRLTNRRSAERLRIFEALTETAERLKRTEGSAVYVEPFIHFCCRIIGWAWNNIDEEHHSDLHTQSREFFRSNFTRPEIVLTAYRNPAAIGQINRIISGRS